MNWTKSAKARLNGSGTAHRLPLQRQRSSDLHHRISRIALSSADAQSTAGSEVSVTSKRLNSLTLRGRGARRSLDRKNDGQPVALF
jgi:hypothetical protein